MQLATQIALGRERLWYYQLFAGIASTALVAAAVKERNPKLLGPLLPFGTAYAFQYDMFYGTMLERARVTADGLLVENPNKFLLPEHNGIVTMEEYAAILGIKDGKKIK